MERKYYQENIVYQIYPRSFCDSNGDGIGDLQGIISKLDYLKDLGVGIIWLSPIYKSPLDDMGYDVASYYEIHPDYGTMRDMEELIKEAKKRNIKILMDLVINHTSDEHEWFLQSKDVNSKYHDYYYWRAGRKNNKKPPNNWDSMFSGSAWEYDEDNNLWYLHLYSKKQVDLNYHNEDVILEVEKILKFWLDKGIYGFRCDVINQIYKTSLKNGRKNLFMTGKEHYLNQEGNHLILKRFYQDVFKNYDAMTVGETFGVSPKEAIKFMDNELTMCFSFEHLNLDKRSIPVFKKKYHPSNLKNVLIKWQKEVDWNTNFFENHDQHRSIERYGDAKKYYLESAKMLATIILTLRGTPFIYQGEEIGMLDNHYDSLNDIQDVSAHRVYQTIKKLLPFLSEKKVLDLVDTNNRDHSRTPMCWDASLHAGFSTAKSWIKEAPFYQEINVQNNLDNPNSIFHYYQSLIQIRRKHLPLSYGAIEFLPSNKNVLCFYRKLTNHPAIFVIINLSKKRIKNPYFEQGEILLSNYDIASLEQLDYLEPFMAIVVNTNHQ